MHGSNSATTATISVTLLTTTYQPLMNGSNGTPLKPLAWPCWPQNTSCGWTTATAPYLLASPPTPRRPVVCVSLCSKEALLRETQQRGRNPWLSVLANEDQTACNFQFCSTHCVRLFQVHRYFFFKQYLFLTYRLAVLMSSLSSISSQHHTDTSIHQTSVWLPVDFWKPLPVWSSRVGALQGSRLIPPLQMRASYPLSLG